jgi:hypothetical protein
VLHQTLPIQIPDLLEILKNLARPEVEMLFQSIFVSLGYLPAIGKFLLRVHRVRFNVGITGH